MARLFTTEINSPLKVEDMTLEYAQSIQEKIVSQIAGAELLEDGTVKHNGLVYKLRSLTHKRFRASLGYACTAGSLSIALVEVTVDGYVTKDGFNNVKLQLPKEAIRNRHLRHWRSYREAYNEKRRKPKEEITKQEDIT